MSSVSAATQSELSQFGSCGGTATLFRSHLAISHPFGSIKTWGCGFRLVVDDPHVERHACDVCFCLPYLQHGHRRVTNAGIPFLIAGDWNVPPSEYLESSWPARVQGEILLPYDLEISCTSGRLIDYAVCHRSVVNIVKLHRFC